MYVSGRRIDTAVALDTATTRRLTYSSPNPLHCQNSVDLLARRISNKAAVKDCAAHREAPHAGVAQCAHSPGLIDASCRDDRDVDSLDHAASQPLHIAVKSIREQVQAAHAGQRSEHPRVIDDGLYGSFEPG